MAVQAAKRHRPMRFDKEKFKILVLYVIWRAGHRDGFGSTKLNKVLWFADARAYVLHKKPITGATYIREKHGPVAKQMLSIDKELRQKGLIEVRKERYSKHDTTKLRAFERPDLSLFNDEELSIVDHWIKHIDEDRIDDAQDALAHDYAWQIAEMGEVIPLYAVLATRVRAPRGKELEWAKAEAARLGLE
jgi:Protein of unknown function (DUF4065)